MSADPGTRRRPVGGRGVTVAATGGLAIGIGALLAVAVRRDSPALPAARHLADAWTAGHRPAPVPFVSTTSLQDLPDASPQAFLDAAPLDEHRARGTAGAVVHPRAPLPLFDSPAGAPFAQLRPAHFGDETWLPVIDQQPGWMRVLLPGRPMGTTGWLDAARVTVVHSRHEVRVHLGAARLRLFHDGRPIGTWAVSTGHPVPAGRTFLLAGVRRRPQAAPLLLRLATHARDGDPGLITIHRWPTGQPEPSSRGCIRVPEPAMTALGDVAPGCLVRIYTR